MAQATTPHKPRSRPVPCECGRGQRDRYAAMCLRCRQDRGYDHAERSGQTRKITDDVLADARRMYEGGDSFRRMAARILDRTEYATASACAESIRHQFSVRGWPTRDRHGKWTRSPRPMADVAAVIANATPPDTAPAHPAESGETAAARAYAFTTTIRPPQPTLRMRSWEELDYSARRDAAYECSHGALPDDRKIPAECDCWFAAALEVLTTDEAAAQVREQDSAPEPLAA